MKKLMIILAVLMSPFLIFVLMRFIECRPDNSVYEVSLPLAQAVVNHTQKYGRPNDLIEVENLPYKLMSCSEKPEGFECRDYFFEKNGKYYTSYLIKPSVDNESVSMEIKIRHKDTMNLYRVGGSGAQANINDLQVHAFRTPTGICAHFSF